MSSVLEFERKQKILQIHLIRIRTFNYILDSRPKRAKSILVFRPKRRRNPTRGGGKYAYNLYKGVTPRFKIK